jgi:osmotically-inducible protein OsmY
MSYRDSPFSYDRSQQEQILESSITSNPLTTEQLNSVALVQRLDSAIKGNPHLSGHQVFCYEEAGTVVIQGRVRSYFQKQMAQESLRNLEGVQRIVNDLQVDWLTSSASL